MVVLISVPVFMVVDIVSGRWYFNEELAAYALDKLNENGVDGSSLKSEDSKRLLERIEESRGGLPGESDIRDGYHSVLEYVGFNLMAPVSLGWGNSMREVLDDKKKIKNNFEGMSKENKDRAERLVQIAYNGSKSYSVYRWYDETKEELGSQFKTKIAEKLIRSILGRA